MKILMALLLAVSWLFGAVDLNKASKQELMSVKGIGEVKAQAIIDYREKQPFKSVDELTNVKGFGDKSVEKLKSEFSVSDAEEAQSEKP
ncbi:helix-hairpin-helix domain-containing protein [Helicobacter sp. MIT 11-5569]|uniref:ComEA family DNA-binding protein n=1 Tax=Helicobacter sp. MIT 11-5569 TaxID=1548151 RepID=UPI00051FA2E0|nr:helix-hairpin-helix domain-containing protein [Helicobacter sp. MIT 11-5569]TLD82920.1 helix-hairpin-helix domain-containing protein [Helicobacter sp. MIT 11-5569]